MKTFNLFVFCFGSFISTSQIFNDNLHFLYRDYPNKVNVLDLKSTGELHLKAKGLVFQKIDSNWIASVTEDVRTTTIYVYNSKEELIYSKDFRIFELPEMDLYYGQSKSGGFINRQERYLFCRYDESFMFNRNLLTIESCEFAYLGRTYVFTGNHIPEPLYEAIQKLPSNCAVVVSCKVKMENGKSRLVQSKVFYTD